MSQTEGRHPELRNSVWSEFHSPVVEQVEFVPLSAPNRVEILKVRESISDMSHLLDELKTLREGRRASLGHGSEHNSTPKRPSAHNSEHNSRQSRPPSERRSVSNTTEQTIRRVSNPTQRPELPDIVRAVSPLSPQPTRRTSQPARSMVAVPEKAPSRSFSQEHRQERISTYSDVLNLDDSPEGGSPHQQHQQHQPQQAQPQQAQQPQPQQNLSQNPQNPQNPQNLQNLSNSQRMRRQALSSSSGDVQDSDPNIQGIRVRKRVSSKPLPDPQVYSTQTSVENTPSLKSLEQERTRRRFAKESIESLLKAQGGSYNLSDIELPPGELRLLERFVESLSKLAVEVHLDDSKRPEGLRRLHNALRALEGWM